jgi:hypothetical protein
MIPGRLQAEAVQSAQNKKANTHSDLRRRSANFIFKHTNVLMVNKVF